MKGDRKAAKTPLGGGGADDKTDFLESTKRSTWAHARAALVLRTKAVATVMRWVAGAKTIQVSQSRSILGLEDIAVIVAHSNELNWRRLLPQNDVPRESSAN